MNYEKFTIYLTCFFSKKYGMLAKPLSHFIHPFLFIIPPCLPVLFRQFVPKSLAYATLEGKLLWFFSHSFLVRILFVSKIHHLPFGSSVESQ